MGTFTLVQWQPDPFTSSGQPVPTAWNASLQTGFQPSSSLSTAQLGFKNTPGSSTAQMDGDTVGAYLNSADLPSAPVGQKMMITPEFIFTTGSEPVVFVAPQSRLGGSMDLQIPTAVGSDTYVNLDLLFRDPSGVRLSFGVLIFHNGASSSAVATGYDAPSNSSMLNSPIGVDQRFVTQAPGSGSWTGTPWAGWRHFQWSISTTQFTAALNYLSTQYPGVLKTTDPAAYQLIEVHLNAEFHFQPAPAELGWSMRALKVWSGSGDE